MNMIPISSKDCPVCRGAEGQCAIVLQPIETLKTVDMKPNEFELRELMIGSRNRLKEREAYIPQKFLCLKGKGFQS